MVVTNTFRRIFSCPLHVHARRQRPGPYPCPCPCPWLCPCPCPVSMYMSVSLSKSMSMSMSIPFYFSFYRFVFMFVFPSASLPRSLLCHSPLAHLQPLSTQVSPSIRTPPLFHYYLWSSLSLSPSSVSFSLSFPYLFPSVSSPSLHCFFPVSLFLYFVLLYFPVSLPLCLFNFIFPFISPPMSLLCSLLLFLPL